MGLKRKKRAEERTWIFRHVTG